MAMKIGIDLDNTIICYDDVFAYVAAQEGYDCNSLKTKKELKSWFHNNDMHDAFTEIQGLVYGKYINEAIFFDEVKVCFETWRADNHSLYIVSHKTKYPVIGEKVDLRKSATEYLYKNGILDLEIVPTSNLFFEDTAASKVARISKLRLDLFIDDLPSILKDEAFPEMTRKILFDPLRKSYESCYDLIAANWTDIEKFVQKNSERLT